MGIFDSKEEKEREERYEIAVSRIAIFPGSVAEYQAFRGYEVEIMSIAERDNKGVHIHVDGSHIGPYFKRIDRELRNHLIDNNIEALVNVHFSSTGIPEVLEQGTYYGLPVRRKKER